MTDLLYGRPVDDERDDRDADIIELAGPDGPPEIDTVPDKESSADDSDTATAPQTREAANAAADQLLEELTPTVTSALSNVVMSASGDQPGYLVLNPLSFARRVVVDIPDASTPPAIGGPVKTAQFDGRRHAALVDVPGSGFAWFPTGDP
jgi:hypothetical protein